MTPTTTKTAAKKTTPARKTAPVKMATAHDAASAAAPMTELLHLKPSDVASHQRNPRMAVGDVTDLATSITEHGVLEPLIVAPWPASMNASAAQKKKHLLIAGHRRLAAAVKAKVTTVPCVVRSDLDTEAKQLEAMLVENLQRTDLTPVEEANAYQALLEFDGFTVASIAKEVGQPLSRVRDRLKLGKLDEPVKTKLHAGQITIADALAIGEFHDDAATTKTLLAAAGGTQFDYTLNRVRRIRQEYQLFEKRLDQLKAAGTEVHKSAPEKTRPLGDLFGWNNYTSKRPPFPHREEEQDAWVVKHHQSCPGAVVWTEKGHEVSSLVYGCTQPKLHPSTPEKTKAELAREKKEREATAAPKLGLAAAADVRTAHLRDYLSSIAPVTSVATLTEKILASGYYESAKDKAARLAWVDELTSDSPRNALVNVLADGDPGEVDLADRLEKRLRTLSCAQLAMVLDLQDHRSSELAMRKPALHFYGHESWIKRLDSVYGYEWTEIERERYKTILEEPAPADEPTAVSGDSEANPGDARDDIDEDELADGDES